MQDPSFASLLHTPDENDDLITFEELRPASKHSSFDHHYDIGYYGSINLENPRTSDLYKSDVIDVPQSTDILNITDEETANINSNRKRKSSLKQNHSEIEKRRRDKMNTYITELSSMIPMCSAMSRKLDKTTVLRMAVEHLKSIRGPSHSYNETLRKPSFMSDQELKEIILQVTEGFVFVIGCERGKILYVSESVSDILHFSQNELLRQSLFDILHPKDVAKLKEQLSSTEQNPREKFLGSKVSKLCPGARRSFFCRIKCNSSSLIKEKSDTTVDEKRKDNDNIDKKYIVIHCTGYLKSWPSVRIGIDDQENDSDGDSYNVSCLIAVGRTVPDICSLTSVLQNQINIKPIQFITKHTLDGKFLFVDQTVTVVLGFLPQELLGCSLFEYVYHEDIAALSECHKIVLQTMEKSCTKVYRLKKKHGGYVNVQSEWRAFKNPWTKETEYLISKNNFITNFGGVEIPTTTNANIEHVEDLGMANNGNQLQETCCDGISKQIEEVTEKISNKEQSDGNDEAAMAIIMSLLEVDAGLGGPVDFSGLPWPLP